jgi:hypothetical protein
MRPGESGEAGCEFRQPVLVDVRKCQGKQSPGRLRTHRGQIAQIHRQNPMANRGGGAPMREMHTVHERVDGRDQVTARGRVEESGIVTDAKTDIRTLQAAVPEVALNKCEF